MKVGETELEMVKRHIREGEGHVSRQLEIIADMVVRGQPTTLAETLIFNFDKTLRAHKAQLEQIM